MELIACKKEYSLKNIFIVLLIVPMSQLALDQYLPSLPAIKAALSSTNLSVQLTISLYLLGLGISQLIYGPISDCYGRKKVLLFGVTVYLTSSLVCATASSISNLLIARFIQGIGIGAGSVLPKAIARDMYENPALAQALSHITVMWSLTTIFAPVVGGYIQQYLGWRANFYILFFYSVVSFFILSAYFSETMITNNKKFNISLVFKSYKSMLKSKPFMGYMLCLVTTFSILISFTVAAPFLLQSRLGLEPSTYGKLIILIGASYIIGNIVSNYLSSKYQTNTVIILGILTILFFSIILLLTGIAGSTNIKNIIIPAALTTFGIGLMYSKCMANALLIFPDAAGSASALLGCCLMVGSAITSSIVAKTGSHDQIPVATIMTTLALLTGLIYNYLIVDKTYDEYSNK